MKLALILLAAGDSRRFGGNKLLSAYNGKLMYRCLVDEVAKLPEGLFCEKVVVTQYEAIEKDLKAEGYLTVRNDESRLGISRSIRLGIEALNGWEAISYCFAVCDQPDLRADTMEGLVRGWQLSGKGLGCPCFNGEPGNPVIFSGRYRNELLSLTGDVGGKRILKRHLDDVYRYEVTDERELLDIDSHENLSMANSDE